VYDESETNCICINVENANGVQYLESPESSESDPGSEFEAIQTQSLSTEIPEPEPESVEFSIMTSVNDSKDSEHQHQEQLLMEW